MCVLVQYVLNIPFAGTFWIGMWNYKAKDTNAFVSIGDIDVPIFISGSNLA